MTIDLDDIESRINDGIYGDDRMTDTARDDAFSALAEILAEVARLRGEAAQERATERAAVVAYLNGCATEGFILLRINEACDAEKWALAIERGEHRREEE